jgi:PAS domain S-box-containing protein
MMNDDAIRVLAIEDNPVDAELVQENLAEAQRVGWGLPRFEIEHVARLEPALERLDAGDGCRFDVVLSDLDLPDSRASETVTTLREHIPHMPLVVLTGREDEALARKSVRAGVQDYLYKNEATGSLLARTLMYAIERQQAHDELERRVERRTAELRQANEDLRDNEAELAAIIESVPFVMMAVDRERRIRKINHSGAEFVGRSPEEMLGLRAGEALRCIHALDDPQGCGFGPACQDCVVRRTVLDTIETGQGHCGVEVTMTFNRQGDEEEMTLLFYATPFTTSGERRALVVFQDITDRKQVEDALRESEERFRLIADTCIDVIFQLDLEGRVTYCTPSAERLLGFPPEEVIGTRLTRFFPESERAEAMDDFRQVIATEESRVLNAEILDHAGTPIPIEATLSPVVKGHEVVGVQGAARDITARRQVEQALKQRVEGLRAINELAISLTNAPLSVDRFKLLADELKHITHALGVSVSAYDPDEQVLVVKYVAAEGKVVARLNDLLEQEIVGFRTPVSDERYVQMTNKIVRRAPNLRATTFGAVPRPVSAAVQRMFGIDHFIGLALAEGDDLLGTAVIVMPKGGAPPSDEVIETFARVATASLQKWRAEKALHESEERLELVIRGGALGTWDWNVQTGEEQFNERWAEMLGYSLEEIKPHVSTWESRVHPDDLSEVYEKLNAHIEGRTPIYEAEFRMRHKSGAWVWILNRGQVIERDAEGRPLRICGVHLDITERKRMEEQLERYAIELERSNRDLEQLAYVVSHDLKEPLRTVTDWLGLLEQRYGEQLDGRAKKYVTHAVSGAERMQEMIKALLDLSRVEKRGQEPAPTDAEVVLKRTLHSLVRAIEEAGAEVTHDPLPTVMADEAQLTQVFQNLIANAVKFRREDVQPRVHISAEREGDEWLFSVADNGIGIDLEQAERLFQIFQRLHTREEYEGTGIGLALCKRIVERHGGRIWVDSEPGEGSTFYFTLPACHA